MNKITQTMRFRQALILYAGKYGVSKAAIRYKTNRQYVYRWLKRYDGTIQSLADKSHRPHSHPNQHTEDELKLIKNMSPKNTTPYNKPDKNNPLPLLAQILIFCDNLLVKNNSGIKNCKISLILHTFNPSFL